MGIRTLALFCLVYAVNANAFTLDTTKSFPDSLQGHDFFIQKESLQINKVTECRAHIKKVMCLVDPAKPGEKPNQRKCLEGGTSYAAPFEKLYDNYPPILQKMFCSLRSIFIEKDFYGTAYGGLYEDENGKTSGAVLGIRKSVLDENLDLHTWASWKEQLSFGGETGSYTIKPELPEIETATQQDVNDFLYFVIAHEFGHAFDFAGDLNKVKTICPDPAKGDDPECDVEKGGWAELSWVTSKKPSAQNSFAHQNELCFYTCNGKTLPLSAVIPTYEGLNQSSFISLYASTNPWEDFADSLAYFLISKYLYPTYSINTKQGIDYDSMAKLLTPQFAEKYKYLENFVNRTDIIYP